MSAALINIHSGKQTEFIRSTADRLFFGGARGGSKGQPLDSIIYTPFGQIKMGEVKVGQKVCTPNGRNANVIGIFPLGEKDIYEVTMQDGGKTRVTEDHLWKYSISCHNWRKSKVDWKLALTSQIIEMMESGKRIMLPVTMPVQFTKSYKCDMRPLHPYFLGLLLGDGCMTGTARVGLTTGDKQIKEWISENYDVANILKVKNQYEIKFDNSGLTETALKKMDLIGKYSDTKFIPKSYLWAPVVDRWELLQGLMDTDGHATSDGKAYYTSVSKQLAENVRFLVKSLGGRCTMTVNPAGYKKDGVYIECKDAYGLYIRMRDNSKLFKLNRKINKGGLNNGGNGELKNKIVSIVKVGKEQAQCIKLDSVESLYLTDDFIVTHNTFGGCYKAAYQARTYHYEDAEGEKIDRKKYLGQIKMNLNPRIIVDTVSIDYPEYKALIIRRTFPDLEINVRPECDKLYLKDAHGNPFAYWLDKKKCYVFPSGAKIFLVHCRDRNALTKYIGGNNHFVFIDEANQFPWEWVEDIGSSVRSSNPLLKAQMILTSNPGGIGHYWLKSRFVDNCPPVELGKKIFYKEFNVSIQPYATAPSYIDPDGVEWQFIPATVFDNPSLLANPNYVNVLKNITNPVKRAMWLEGRWDAAPGLFFDNFIYDDAHVLQQKDFIFDRDFSTNTHNFYRFIDYGTKNATAVLFAAVNKKTAKMVIFDELIMRQGNLVKDEFDFDFDVSSAPSVQARMILAYTKSRHPYLHEADFEENIADSAMWQKTSEKNNELYSPAELFEEAGLELTSCGKKERVNEAAIVYNSFVPLEDGIPRTQITENCLYLIETIQSADQNPNNIDDLDTQGEDHAIDALKYGSKYVFGTVTEQPKKEPGWRNELKNEINDQQNGHSWRAA